VAIDPFIMTNGVSEKEPSAAQSMDTGLSRTDLSESMAKHHQRVDPTNWEQIFVVGDVHGCHTELEALLGKLSVGADDLVIFVGDLVRKGPASAAVLETIRGRENCLSVRGNNEQKLIDGRVSLAGVEPHREWLEALPAVISLGESLVTHGGIDPRIEFADHGLRDFQEVRALPASNGYDGPFWFEQHRSTPRVFFGHTVLSEPVDTPSAVGLDTGCVYGGALTAYDYRADAFVSVDAERAYVERRESKILDIPALHG
jgi:serine/threonine protein phosphatase 1